MMTAVRMRTRGLAAASAVTLLLGLAACGGDDDTKDSSDGPSQDPDVEFTGDPVTVMTMTAYDTDTLNVEGDPRHRPGRGRRDQQRAAASTATSSS